MSICISLAADSAAAPTRRFAFDESLGYLDVQLCLLFVCRVFFEFTFCMFVYFCMSLCICLACFRRIPPLPPPHKMRSVTWLRTNGVNIHGAAVKVMNLSKKHIKNAVTQLVPIHFVPFRATSPSCPLRGSPGTCFRLCFLRSV